MKHTTMVLMALAAGFASSVAGLVERTVAYQADGVALEGFHVYDSSRKGKRPAVLVIHQWTGLSDYEKGRARMLAGMGYNVLAADIYGKGIRPQPPEAGKQAGIYKGDRALFRQRLTAGLDLLKADERTDPAKVAAIGYCFGGTGVLELARAGAGLAGVVSFHGGLDAAEGFAVHSFTHREAGDDPSKGAAYHEAADRRSWIAMKAFFDELFGK
jgi:dienelactone hydrolase